MFKGIEWYIFSGNVSAADGITYQNWMRVLLQNIPEEYIINMQFGYILIRWQRLVYDENFLKNFLFDKNLINLEKKYYLVDTKYYNTNYLLYEYCNINIIT